MSVRRATSAPLLPIPLRFLVVSNVLASGIAAYLAQSSAQAASLNFKLSYSFWDIFLACINNWMYLNYICVVTLIVSALIGLSRTFTSGVLTLIAVRNGKWWLFKYIVVTCLILTGVALVSLLIFSFVFGQLSGSGAILASPLARSMNSERVSYSIFMAISSTRQAMAVLCFAFLLLTVGLVSCLLFYIGVALYSNRTIAALGTLFFITMADWIFTQRIDLLRHVSPGLHLLEGSYRMSGKLSCLTTLEGALIFSVFAGVGVFLILKTPRLQNHTQ